MAIIPLSKGKHAIVDDADFEYLSQWKWMCSSTGYAVRHRTINKKTITIRMHRELIDVPDGMFADHVNGNRLDNRRANLRVCTHAQNQHNYRSTKNMWGYKGVAARIKGKSWHARIKVNGKTVHLGHFDSIIAAARAYNDAALHYFGEFACLNDLDSEPRS